MYIDSFSPYTAEFNVITVPEGRGIPLGMPWLRDVNPNIDWVRQTIALRTNYQGK